MDKNLQQKGSLVHPPGLSLALIEFVIYDLPSSNYAPTLDGYITKLLSGEKPNLQGKSSYGGLWVNYPYADAFDTIIEVLEQNKITLSYLDIE